MAEVRIFVRVVTSCFNCPHMQKQHDPEPDDWFRDNNVAYVCTKTPENKSIISGVYAYEDVSDMGIPKWCPLQKINVD